MRVRTLPKTFANADLATKRQLLHILGASFTINAENVVVKLKKPFSILSKAEFPKGSLEPSQSGSESGAKMPSPQVLSSWLPLLEAFRTEYLGVIAELKEGLAILREELRNWVFGA